jgi:ATP-dependent helicase/nuclease subunit A
MQWSPQQKKVIETRDKNILVSAAAGSGKTAVLVERIIQKIIKDKKNVDRMLVVTFTNAAASEMRERVLKAIERELELQPQNEHLQKQQSYIHNAHITTIHSFCLNLLREHYLELQLDPGFQVADTNEIELMKGEVLEELLEKEYETAEPEFLAFVNQFMVRNSDKAIEGMILDLYEEAMGYP